MMAIPAFSDKGEKLALNLKEQILRLKENGVDVSDCLEIVNDLILEI